MDTNKKNLIYIASNGRSGSTLLGLLLNSLDGVWEVGEINFLFWESISPQYGCGCGKSFSDCEFWSSVMEKLDRNIDIKNNLSLFREKQKGGKIIRPKLLFDIFFKNREIASAGDNGFCVSNKFFLGEVEKEAQKVTGEKINYLVDNSKDFYRLFRLIKCGDFDIKIVHIIKDPRAFIYSIIRHKKINFFTKVRKIIRMSLRYNVENFLIRKVSEKVPGESVLVIRYEDLVINQKKYLKQICSWLKIDNCGAVVDLNRRGNHVIGPNSVKSEIVFEEKWKTGLSKFDKFLIVFITYFSAKKYGYFKK